jgi:CP family cyanate transporter-like MFS transporter
MRNGGFPSILLICLYAALISACIGKMIPLVPVVAHDLAVPATQAAWLISVVSVAGILIAPFSARLIAVIGGRPLFIGAIVVEIVGSAIGALSRSFAELMLGRFLEGFALFFVATAALTLIMRTTEGSRRSSAVGLFAAAVPFGIGLGIFAAGPLANAHWRLAFWGQAGALALSTLALPLLPRPAKAALAPDLPGNFFNVYKNHKFVKLAIAFSVTTLVQFCAISIFPTFLKTVHVVSLSAASAIGAIGLLTGILGNVVASILMERGVKPRPILIIALPILSILTILVFSPGLRLNYTVAGYTGLMFVTGGLGSVLLSLIPLVAGAPEGLGRINAGINQLNNVPVFIGPPLIFMCFAAGGTLLVQGVLFVCSAAITLLAFALGAFNIAARRELPSAPAI